MAIAVYWTDFDKIQLSNIFDYFRQEASREVAMKVTSQIVEKTVLLGSFPMMGVVEELLSHRPQGFRYLVSTNYKIIYWHNTKRNRIEVVDVFDTRQNPEKISRNK